jgi:hypothetical protein
MQRDKASRAGLMLGCLKRSAHSCEGPNACRLIGWRSDRNGFAAPPCFDERV